MKKAVVSQKAPSAIGPYSQAVKAGSCIFTSGQIPIDPSTGELAEGDIESLTRRALENLKAVLEAGGFSLEEVVKTTVFITDMEDFATVNRIYSEYFEEPYPARSCIQAAKLPKNAPVEIEAVAFK